MMMLMLVAFLTTLAAESAAGVAAREQPVCLVLTLSHFVTVQFSKFRNNSRKISFHRFKQWSAVIGCTPVSTAWIRVQQI